MATVGALVVELRANSAQFRSEMENSRKGLQEVGGHAALSAQSLSRFGAIAVQEVIPGLEGSRVALEGVIKAGINAQGTLALVARGGLLVAAALAGYAMGNALANFRELRKEGHGFVEALQLAIGHTKSFAERMKEAADEERAFVEQISAAQTLRLGFSKKAIQADADIAASGRQLAGDEVGAARAAMDGKLALLEIEKKESIKNILEQARDGKITTQAKSEFLLQIEKQYVADRNAAYMKGSLDIQKLEDAAAQKRVATWQQETQAIVDQLKSRLQARQQFEGQLGSGATALGITDSSTVGMKRAAEIRENSQKALRDVSFEEREGRLAPRDAVAERQKIIDATTRQLEALKGEFAGVPAVVDKINTSLTEVQTGSFGAEMEKARDWVNQNIDSQDQLQARLRSLNDMLTDKVPAAAAAAGPAIQKLKQDYTELAWAIFGAREQASLLAGGQ